MNEDEKRELYQQLNNHLTQYNAMLNELIRPIVKQDRIDRAIEYQRRRRVCIELLKGYELLRLP